MTRSIMLITAAAACVAMLASAAMAGGLAPLTVDKDIVLPADCGYKNVKTDFGAQGDGVTDDTAALNKSGADATNPDRSMYFPKGTYLVSDTILVGASKWRRRIIQGENQAKTIIRLKDNSPGFEDPKKPKPVLEFFPGKTTGVAFGQSMYDITVDVGRGNPGAIAVRWMCNNYGCVRNVTIQSSDVGGVGFQTAAWPGPGLVKNLTIVGFDIGINDISGQYYVTYEHVRLIGQKKIGAVLTGSRTLRDLRTDSACLAVQNRGTTTLLDSELAGAGAAAIENNGSMFIRNLTTSGFAKAVGGKNPGPDATTIDEWANKVYSLFPGSGKTVNLPAEETPEPPEFPLSQWAKVNFPDAAAIKAAADAGQPAPSDSAAIQAAIDSGKPVVYLPRAGRYVTLKEPVRVRGKVVRIVGMHNDFVAKTGDQPTWIIEDGDSPTVWIDRLWTGYGGNAKVGFKHVSKRTLVLTDVNPGSFDSMEGGNVFVENACAGPWVFGPQKVWARMINPESQEPNILTHGTDLWLLGLKIEKGNISLIADGGRVEVLGSYILQNRGAKTEQNFVLKDCKATLSISNGMGIHKVQVEETQGGETRKLTKDQTGYVTPLYISN